MDTKLTPDQLAAMQRFSYAREAELFARYGTDDRRRVIDLMQVMVRAGGEVFAGAAGEQILDALDALKAFGYQYVELDDDQPVELRTLSLDSHYACAELEAVRGSLANTPCREGDRALFLRAVSGFSWEELAADAGLTVRTIRSRARKCADAFTARILTGRLVGCGAFDKSLPKAIYGLYADTNERECREVEALIAHVEECSRCADPYVQLVRACSVAAAVLAPLARDHFVSPAARVRRKKVPPSSIEAVDIGCAPFTQAATVLSEGAEPDIAEAADSDEHRSYGGEPLAGRTGTEESENDRGGQEPAQSELAEPQDPVSDLIEDMYTSGDRPEYFDADREREDTARAGHEPAAIDGPRPAAVEPATPVARDALGLRAHEEAGDFRRPMGAMPTPRGDAAVPLVPLLANLGQFTQDETPPIDHKQERGASIKAALAIAAVLLLALVFSLASTFGPGGETPSTPVIDASEAGSSHGKIKPKKANKKHGKKSSVTRSVTNTPRLRPVAPSPPPPSAPARVGRPAGDGSSEFLPEERVR